MKRILLLIGIISLIFLAACTPVQDTTLELNPQQIAEVPYGEPAFPNLGQYWVIDTQDWLSKDTEKYVDAELEKLRADGYAEVAIVLMSGVNNTLDYTTQLGRYLKLGEAEGPNKENGLVWVLYVDKEEIRRSAGDGLNEATSIDLDRIEEQANILLPGHDYNQVIVTLTDATVAILHDQMDVPEESTKPETPSGDVSEETSEEDTTLLLVGLGLLVLYIIFCVGVGVVTGDWELTFDLIMLLLRILLLAMSGGKAGGSSGRRGSGGGSFSGRTR